MLKHFCFKKVSTKLVTTIPLSTCGTGEHEKICRLQNKQHTHKFPKQRTNAAVSDTFTHRYFVSSNNLYPSIDARTGVTLETLTSIPRPGDTPLSFYSK